MRKVKDKTNLLVIMESLSRQAFKIHAFGQGKQRQLNRKVKLLKQAFRKHPQLKRQMKIRNILQTVSVKDKRARTRIVQSAVAVRKKMDNSKTKKQLLKRMRVDERYWIKPNKIQQNIGNLLNNSKYYGMRFYRQQQSQVRDVLVQSISSPKMDKSRLSQSKTLQGLCSSFNSKYAQLPDGNKKLIKDFFVGNVIEQKKVLKQVVQLKQSLSDQGKKMLDFITQNVSKMDKFDKVFILTSVLQESKR